MLARTTIIRILPFWVLAVIATIFVRNHAFFWDTIQLGSKHAHWYFEHDFQFFFLPEAIDSGHPPTFGMYLAACWTVFGKSLAVSHFAMLPFLFLNIFFAQRVGAYFLGERASVLFLALLCVDPTFAAQAILVSPDMAVMAFFFMGLYGVFYEKKCALLVASLCLAAISMRGMMLVVVLYVSCLLQEQSKPIWRQLIPKALPFVPSGLLALAFLGAHYVHTGWIGYHADSPWASSFNRVDGQAFLKNIGILGWRMLDFGRVFIWIVLLTLGTQLSRRRGVNTPIFRQLMFLNITCLLILTPSLLIYKGLLGHRYLLPIFAVLSLVTCYLSMQLSKKWRLVTHASILIGLAAGNCWIYPSTVAQGWDATLAHLPHYSLRTNMLQYLAENKIPIHEVGSVFPEIGARKYKELNELEEGFVAVDLSTNNYVFYSSVMNDFTDKQLKTLKSNWKVVKKFEKNGLQAILYTQK